MSTKVVWDDDGVTWLPHPGAPRTVTFSFPGRPDRASAFASGVRAIVTDQMTWSDSTPFWMVGIAWMHHDGSRLAPGSIGKYRGDIFKVLIPAIGGVKLADLGRDAYQRLFDHLDADDASESKRREAARTVGTIGSWLQTSGRWPYPADPFGPGAAQRAIRHSAFAKGHDADIRSGRKALKIGADMCPRFDDTVAFAETLTEVVVDRWGPHAAYLGQALVVQYLTGYRLGELLAARPEEFHLNGGRHVVEVHHQIDASRRPTATGPVLKAPKNHTSRELVVWS